MILQQIEKEIILFRMNSDITENSNHVTDEEPIFSYYFSFYLELDPISSSTGPDV